MRTFALCALAIDFPLALGHNAVCIFRSFGCRKNWRWWPAAQIVARAGSTRDAYAGSGSAAAAPASGGPQADAAGDGNEGHRRLRQTRVYVHVYVQHLGRSIVATNATETGCIAGRARPSALASISLRSGFFPASIADPSARFSTPRLVFIGAGR